MAWIHNSRCKANYARHKIWFMYEQQRFFETILKGADKNTNSNAQTWNKLNARTRTKYKHIKLARAHSPFTCEASLRPDWSLVLERCEADLWVDFDLAKDEVLPSTSIAEDDLRFRSWWRNEFDSLGQNKTGCQTFLVSSHSLRGRLTFTRSLISVDQNWARKQTGQFHIIYVLRT